MSARAYYFRTLERMTDGLSQHSDPLAAECFGRLGRLFRLMDLRTAAGEEPSIDMLRSGLPLLREVISVSNDQRDAASEEVRPDSEIRAEMLDEMMIHRRVPDARLSREMARSLYVSAVREIAKHSGRTPVFQSDAERSFAYALPGDGTSRAIWDFWDGTSSRAAMVIASFSAKNTFDGLGVDEEMVRVRGVANRFSGSSYTPLSLATEIDDVTEVLRLTRLSKITVGPFLSEFFSQVDDPVMDAMKAADDVEDAWAVRWTVDRIVSGGTKMVGGGLFRAARPQQNFLVNLQDPDCAMRSVTSFERHVAMPHGMFQRVSARRNECPSLKSSAVHVLVDGGRLIENT